MAISTAVDLSAVARVVGIKTEFKDLRGGKIVFLPQRIAVVGQGSSAVTYPTTKVQLTSAVEVGTTFGFGSPLHLAARQLLPSNGDGVGTLPVTFYPLEDAGSSVASTGDITPIGSQTVAAAYSVKIGGISSEQFVISVGDTVADITLAMTTAINSVLEIPVVATDATTKVNLAAKWAGVSGDDIDVEVVGSLTSGTTFGVTDMNGGLINPSVQDALDQIGGIWETIVVNCLDAEDTTNLDLYSTFNEGRWGSLVKKPLVVFTGSTAVTVNDAITIPDARKTDRTNIQMSVPGSKELPLAIAARAVSRIAPVANNNPADGYATLPLSGITGGTDAQQWTYPQRDQAVKGGTSTTELKDGVVVLSDTVTFFHPVGDPIPSWRRLTTIIKEMNVIFNLGLIFESQAWAEAPLLPDDQATTNATAKKPKHAKAAIASMTDNLALSAIISDPDFAKENTIVGISDQNPDRLDISYTHKVSGNTVILSIDNNFGFYYGTSPIVE